jgi:outer membrane protein assembly factor BamA
LNFRFLAVLLFILSGSDACFAQQVFTVQWDSSVQGRSSEFRYFTDRNLAEDLRDSLILTFREQGFLEGVFGEESKADTVYFRWDAGRLFSWEKVDLGSFPEAFVHELGTPSLDYQGPYRWMEKGLEVAENSGFPFAELKIDSLKVRDSLISGRIDYKPGPFITWDSLVLVGESKTKPVYLQLMSGLKPGAPFSQKELSRATQALSKSFYFSLVDSAEVSFQTQQAKPVFTIQDRRVNVFDGVVGLIPNENQPGKMLITGEVDLRLYHLGGKGRDVSIQWQRLNIQSQSLDVKAKEAFVFRSPLDVQVGFALLKQDTSFVNRTFDLDFGYRMSAAAYFKFFTRRQAGDLISVETLGHSQSAPPADYRWNQYGVGLDWDRLDSPISPRKGMRLQTQFSLGNKRVLENSGLPEGIYDGLDESSPQYQGWLSAEKYIFFKPTWGMWVRGTGAFLENRNLFLNEFLRLGGLKSIRGFNEKSFYAKAYGFVNVEQRLYFDQRSFLVLFSDFGVLTNPYADQKIDRPFSFGTGINLDTDGGLFSFVFALGKSATQPMSFSYSRIHFGYLARF